jgi:hypothetical protein
LSMLIVWREEKLRKYTLRQLSIYTHYEYLMHLRRK